MNFRVRPAVKDDFQAIYEMAKLTGGGFTNLPPDRGALVAKLSRSDDGFSRDEDAPEGDLFFFVLENVDTGQIRGTCQVFSRVGLEQPFYSYRISTLSQTSPRSTTCGSASMAASAGRPSRSTPRPRNCSRWSGAAAPISDRRSAGATRAACATATISRRAACR